MELPSPTHTAYLDDVSTGGNTIPEAWRSTILMVTRLALRGLPLGASKCKFMGRSAEVLGVELMTPMYRVGPKALKHLLASKIPRSLKEL